MGEKRNVFQVVVLGIFIFFIVAAVLAFASFSGGGATKDVGPVVMWGVVDQNIMDGYLHALNEEDPRVSSIEYQQVAEETFQIQLVEALANGTGPDLFIMDQSNLVRHWDKVQPIPYETMSERDYKDAFIDESEMFLSTAGIRALPFSVDPLVLYWNRDIFAESGFSRPPAFWDELFSLSEKMTVRDKANNIQRATIGFGEYDNVSHAKDIIAALIMQAGGQIVERSATGQLSASLAAKKGTENVIVPAQTALRFYTEFADPVKSVYTWNRSLPNSLEAFAQGRLALYVGYASEVPAIQQTNDHINFDVAPLPQIRTGEQKRIVTFSKLYALAVPRTAQNVAGATQMALFLSGESASKTFADTMGIPSPRRDVLSAEPSNPLDLIFRNAALIGRGWFDPQPEETAKIFRRMIGDVTSGARHLADTIQRADDELNALLNR